MFWNKCAKKILNSKRFQLIVLQTWLIWTLQNFPFLLFFSGGEGTQEGEGHGNKVRPTKSSKSSNFQINLYDTKRIDEKHQERIHYMHNQANAKFITSSNVVVISFLIVILNLVVRFWNFNSRAWRNNYCLKRLLTPLLAA